MNILVLVIYVVSQFRLLFFPAHFIAFTAGIEFITESARRPASARSCQLKSRTHHLSRPEFGESESVGVRAVRLSRWAHAARAVLAALMTLIVYILALDANGSCVRCDACVHCGA